MKSLMILFVCNNKRTGKKRREIFCCVKKPINYYLFMLSLIRVLLLLFYFSNIKSLFSANKTMPGEYAKSQQPALRK